MLYLFYRLVAVLLTLVLGLLTLLGKLTALGHWYLGLLDQKEDMQIGMETASSRFPLLKDESPRTPKHSRLSSGIALSPIHSYRRGPRNGRNLSRRGRLSLH